MVLIKKRQNSTKEYNREVRKAKREWLKQNGIIVDEIHIVKYGTPKHQVTKANKETQLLFDDDDIFLVFFCKLGNNKNLFSFYFLLNLKKNSN